MINKELFELIARLPRHINSPAYDFSLDLLNKEYGFEVIKYTKKDEHNGWVIPPKYEVKNAYIKLGDQIIFDGMSHPLNVISYSASFRGYVNGDELKRHCYYDHRNQSWTPYHFRQSYRPWQRDWGFCMPKVIYDQLSTDIYDVCIEVADGLSELRIGKAFLEGASHLKFVFCAHLDHPGLANDDLSGVIVLCEVFKRLRNINLSYGCEFILVPEIIGPQFYLNSINTQLMLEGLFVESVGQSGAFKLQKSQSVSFLIENTLLQNIRMLDDKSELVEFRKFYGNDEINFESYGCPMPSLTRGKFEGYHSDQDNFQNLCFDKIEETINLILKTISDLQKKIIIEKNFSGLICCGNPKYDLYVDPGQIAFGTNSISPGLRRVMDFMSRYGKILIFDQIVKECDSDEDETLEYLKNWERVGLINIHGLR